ncbi:amino acid dehydrogenase [Hahella sp. SMD15-11]|uniref:Amino acid dehydrogenase n=1 Tax=Thermohahella caldifontis TaxID=3142973 RepID=A0AB39USX7_9GAMM
MFTLLDRYRVNALHVRDDAATGLKAIIAIHNTRFGPALGGCRFVHYHSTDAALEDAVRLARGMSYKAVMAGLPQGGGKSVILKPRGPHDREALFREFGRFVDSLGGEYITAIDAGTGARDMDWIGEHTPHVTSTSHEVNPSVFTARGVYEGIRAAVRHKLDRDDLEGLRIAVQGLGNVGWRLCEHLHAAGARLIVSDIEPERVQRAVQTLGAEAVAPEDIYAVPCVVFAPCGLGGIINPETLKHLHCRIVAGSANNQLLSEADGVTLHKHGILYAPDYVINAGGLIYASLNHLGHSLSEIETKTLRIGETLLDLFEQADTCNLPPSVMADQLAESRLYGELSRAA